MQGPLAGPSLGLGLGVGAVVVLLLELAPLSLSLPDVPPSGAAVLLQPPHILWLGAA